VSRLGEPCVITEFASYWLKAASISEITKHSFAQAAAAGRCAPRGYRWRLRVRPVSWWGIEWLGWMTHWELVPAVANDPIDEGDQ